MRVRKNSGNFISNGPILLVWVTHRKFELEGLIRKLFTVKPRANGRGFPWAGRAAPLDFPQASLAGNPSEQLYPDKNGGMKQW